MPMLILEESCSNRNVGYICQSISNRFAESTLKSYIGYHFSRALKNKLLHLARWGRDHTWCAHLIVHSAARHAYSQNFTESRWIHDQAASSSAVQSCAPRDAWWLKNCPRWSRWVCLRLCSRYHMALSYRGSKAAAEQQCIFCSPSTAKQ